MMKKLWRAFYEYMTYEYYGRRKWRVAAYGLLLAVLTIVGMFAAAAVFTLQAPRGTRLVPTYAPPTATAIVARIATATASAPPTPTPAPLCPDDPRLWRLVEVKPFLDPKTSKPVGMIKPVYRIDPPCVYQGFWRFVAHKIFLVEPSNPTKEKMVENVPWYWSPGTEIVYFPLKPVYSDGMDFIFYKRNGERIDEVLTIYTAIQTGDRDYPVVVYLYRDYPDAAYAVQWEEGGIRDIRRVTLTGGTVVRRVYPYFYDARGRRWVMASPLTEAVIGQNIRVVHATEADGSILWGVLGMRGFRRSELAAAFGLKEFFPEKIDWNRQDVRPLIAEYPWEIGP